MGHQYCDLPNATRPLSRLPTIIFLLHTNTLACVKDIAHALEFTLVINCAESVRRSNVYIFYL